RRSGVGGLQPLLEDERIGNTDVNGHDRVFLGYADGREVMAEPVADSDQELVELIQALAAYSGLSSRPFDTAYPQLDLRLPDGSRLSAVMDLTLPPAISLPPPSPTWSPTARCCPNWAGSSPPRWPRGRTS